MYHVQPVERQELVSSSPHTPRELLTFSFLLLTEVVNRQVTQHETLVKRAKRSITLTTTIYVLLVVSKGVLIEPSSKVSFPDASG